MDKAKKQTIKRIISLVCVVAVVALLAAMPLLTRQDEKQDGVQASILSGTAVSGSIDTCLMGGGTLAEEEAVSVSVPSAVKLEEFLVSNGDYVTEGTPVAKVDRVTVMTAISQVQETLDYLSEQIEDSSSTDSKENITALAGGIVKILYAEEGDSVQSVMLEHGALAVLSLDGLMAVDLETNSDLSAGTSVTVTLADGSTIEGSVAKNLMGTMTITVEDNGYAVGEAVEAAAEDGTVLGSGALYIYSPWNATAYAGTVESVKVSVGDKLSAGKKLMVLKDVGYSAAYRQLIGQRQEYEELMLELFEMYQTQTVTAPCDGVVSGIDKNSVQLLSDSGVGYKIQFLVNAPNGNDEILYSNYVGKVTAVGQNGWSLLVNPQPVAIADYTDLSGVSLDERAMTQVCTYPPASSDNTQSPEETVPPQDGQQPPQDATPPQDGQQPPQDAVPPQGAPQPGAGDGSAPETFRTAPIYEKFNGTWQQISVSAISKGDVLLFAADGSGEFVWIVRIQKGESNQNAAPPSGGMSGFPQGGMSGYPQGGMTQPESAFELYGLEFSQIAAVTPQDTMTLEITVDELDIKSLQVGMTAQLRIDALGGEKYTASITEIGNTGSSNGGNSKYTVELTLERGENMLSGMNASVTITLSTTGDVLTIPADALVEQGNQTIVYTGYDADRETLLNPVVVKTGISDGETVEILEGLIAGQTFYYAYYDTLEVSFTPDFGGGFMFGR